MNPPDVWTLMKDANPQPETDDMTSDAWSTAVLLAEIDTRRQQMSMDLETRESPVTSGPGPRRDHRWLMAAAAFVLTVGVIGAMAWLVGTDSEPDGGPVATTTAAPTTTAVQTTATTTEPPGVSPETPRSNPLGDPVALEDRAVLEEYFDAFNDGDVDRVLALYSDEMVIAYQDLATSRTTTLRPGDDGYEKEAELIPTFMMNIGTQWTFDLDQCGDRDGTVVCVVRRTDPLIRQTLLSLQEILYFQTDDGQITYHEYDCTGCGFEYTVVLDEFATWMRDIDFETSKKMILSSGEPILTEESAQLWLQHLPKYFADRFQS